MINNKFKTYRNISIIAAFAWLPLLMAMQSLGLLPNTDKLPQIFIIPELGPVFAGFIGAFIFDEKRKKESPEENKLMLNPGGVKETEFQKIVSKAGGTSSQCIMIIQDVYWPHDPLHISIGDLFVTPQALILIEWAVCEHMSGLGIFGGAIAGGAIGAIAGGIGFSQSDKAHLDNAKAQVKAARIADYAMSFEERLRRHPTAIVITRNEIHSIELNKKGTLKISYAGEELNLALVGYTSEYTEKLRNWQSGKIENEPNEQGMNLGLPSIDSLLTSLETGKEHSEVSLHKLSSNVIYMTKFWSQFGTISTTRQDAIVKIIIKDKSELQASCRDHFRETYAKTSQTIWYSFLAPIIIPGTVGAVLSIFMTDFWSRSFDAEGLKILILIELIVFLLSLGAIYESFAARKKVKNNLLLLSQ